MTSSHQPVSVFLSYAHEDVLLRDEWVKHLKLLVRQGIITTGSDQDITAGSEWAGQISRAMESAQIVLLLISADFLASDYCYGIEMRRALERHDIGEACVIPIILREVDWTDAPFGKLKHLPTNAKSVNRWSDRDRAFKGIAQEIRRVAQTLQSFVNSAGVGERWGEFPQAENLPRSGAVEFVGREGVLAQIHQILQHSSPNRDTAIAGMGGIGKTELATKSPQQSSGTTE